jgi:uncharacterized protein (DUF1501 family)
MIQRRAFLRSLCLGSQPAPSLVVVFLRGGADGLNLVPPRFEKAYFDLRPTLALRETLPLDERFGLNPGLAPLLPYFKERRLAIVHAAGSDDETRSHFEAQDLMERAGRPTEGAAGGWLARHLRTRPGRRGAVAAVSISPTLPEALRGAPSACAMESMEQVAIPEASPAFTQALRVLYEAEGSGVGQAGQATFRLLERIAEARSAALPEGYPETSFGKALREVARLLKAEVGLEAACVDLDGWDTHFTQAPALSGLVADLAGGLAAFAKDLGPRMDDTVVVVMTEFGRRSYENATFGTDHGRASVMFALGGPVRGGRVITQWPGFEGNALEGPGDLRVTIDFRDVLSEILSRAMGNPRMEDVFPGHRATDRGIIAAG